MVQVQKNVCLIVIDGWGISENKEGTSYFHVGKTYLFEDFISAICSAIDW